MPNPNLWEVSTVGHVVTISPFPAEKVTSLGKDWHRPCLRCERCGKTLTPGGHAEVRGVCEGALGAGRLDGRGREGARASGGEGHAGRWGLPPGGQSESSRARLCSSLPLPCEWTGHGFGSLKAVREGGRHVDKEEATRGSGVTGVRGPPPNLHPAPSTMASPTATSPVMEYSSDPRVSVARRGGELGPPLPLPTAPHHPATSLYRSQHWSRGQLHL